MWGKYCRIYPEFAREREREREREKTTLLYLKYRTINIRKLTVL
jgi:hypothetical protein